MQPFIFRWTTSGEPPEGSKSHQDSKWGHSWAILLVTNWLPPCMCGDTVCLNIHRTSDSRTSEAPPIDLNLCKKSYHIEKYTEGIFTSSHMYEQWKMHFQCSGNAVSSLSTALIVRICTNTICSWINLILQESQKEWGKRSGNILTMTRPYPDLNNSEGVWVIYLHLHFV